MEKSEEKHGKEGQKLGTIGYKIDKIATRKNLGNVKNYVGHGIGQEMHEWSGSVLIAGVLEGTIESQKQLFKTIIKDTYLTQRFNDAKFEGKKKSETIN